MIGTRTNTSDYLLAHGHDAVPVVIDRDGSHTYGDLRHAVDRLAGEIQGWGTPRGSRIGLLSRNSFFWVAAYLAIMKLGHVVVPFATALTPEDVTAKASFVGCEAFLVDRAARRRFSSALTGARHVVDDSFTSKVGTGRPAEAPPTVDVGPDDDAVLVFTSGTTAAPRAVRISHRNIQANTDSIVEYLGLQHDDRMLVVLPFSYCFGASLLHTHLRVGGSVSLCDTLAYPETVVEAIERDGCTGLAGVPSSFQLLLRASTFGTRSLPTLRHVQQAGGRLPQPQIEQLAAAQSDARLFVMYGQTEATARLSFLPPELLAERAGSIGRGIPGVTLEVVDDAGRPVPSGTVGEILARGASIARGYWDDEAGTAEKFVDGALRTGDLGRADDDGFIYIVDRQGDFIKSWGFRISGAEIEDAVVAIPGVGAAAAVGRPDPEAGEAVVLFYVADPEAAVTPADVLDHCRRVLARHMVPQEARLLESLPVNQNGKVVKSALRALASRSTPPEPEESQCAPA